MKKTLTHLTTLLIILAVFSGCAGTPAPSGKTDDKVPQILQEDTSADPVIIRIPVLISEIKYQRNDYIDTKTVNTYEDGSDRLIKSITYDNSGVILETSSAEYSSEKVLFAWFDRENNLLKKKMITYDKTGNVTAAILYDNTGKQISRSVYRYEADNSLKSKWEIYDSADVLLGYNEYIYENGNNIRANSYSPAGTLEEYFLYKYSNELMTEMSHYSKTGKKISGAVYAYNKDTLIANEIIYKGEKSVINEIIYEYSEKDGKRTEKNIIKTPDGTVVETVEKVFAFIEKEIKPGK